MQKIKNILITGGAGFIGSNLAEYLLSFNDSNIFSLDDYSTGSKDNHISGVTYIEGCTSEIFEKVKFRPDVIYHLGEYSRVEQSFDDIEKVFHSNRLGTQTVLEYCRKYPCKLVYAGSSTKFGDGGLSRNQSPYGWTKASNTELVVNYTNWFNISAAIVYFYNAYGPREIASGKYATLIALFYEKMKNGEDLTVVSPGTQVRNFTHVSDIVRGLKLVADFGNGDDFGIGNEQAYSVLEIAQAYGGRVRMVPERRGNRMAAEVITEKTRSLGWEPRIDVIDYIESQVRLLDTKRINK